MKIRKKQIVFIHTQKPSRKNQTFLYRLSRKKSIRALRKLCHLMFKKLGPGAAQSLPDLEKT